MGGTAYMDAPRRNWAPRDWLVLAAIWVGLIAALAACTPDAQESEPVVPVVGDGQETVIREDLAFDPDFAGAHVDPETGDVVVNMATVDGVQRAIDVSGLPGSPWPDPSGSDAPAGISEVQKVAYTVDQLDTYAATIANKLNTAFAAGRTPGVNDGQPWPFKTQVDVAENKIEVTVASTVSLSQARQTILNAGVPQAAFSISTGEIHAVVDYACTSRSSCDDNPLRGGIRLYGPNGNSICTSGFAMVKDKAVGMSTAGHCIQGGTTYYHGGKKIGSTQKSYWQGSVDAQFFSVGNGWYTSNVVYRDLNRATRVTGKIRAPSEATSGVTLCKLGATSGETCGRLITHSLSELGLSVGWGVVNLLGCQGDSGAAIIDRNTNRAYGLLVGPAGPEFMLDGKRCSNTIRFTWINKAEDHLGAKVLLSPDPNAPDPTGPPTTAPPGPVNRPPATPTIVQPASGSTVATIRPTLQARSTDPDGDPVTYRFTINVDGVLLESGWISQGSWQVPANRLDPGGRYTWTVQARDPSGARSGTRAASFNVASLPVARKLVSTASGNGYWYIASDGGVFTFGDAQFYGSMGGKPLNAPVIGGARTRSGNGYWLVATDGGVFSFGDAQFYGSMGGKPLNKPVVAMSPTPTGRGYWLVAADGGVFSFGDAQFYGSMGGKPLNYPVVDFQVTPSGKGYTMTAKDGGVFTFGDARFFGSMAGHALNGHITSIITTPRGLGYWLLGCDGGIFTFGDAVFHGSRPVYQCSGIPG